MTNMRCCKISESKILTLINKVDIRMKSKKNLNNNKKLEEQDAKHNDNENDVKISDIIYVYLSINIISF